jgi:hypothetical protein
LEDLFGGQGLIVIGSQGDGGWYLLRGANFFPYYFGHDAFGCTFINDTLMNCDVLNINWILKTTRAGRHGSPLSRSKVMSLVSSISTTPKAERNDFR